MWRHRSLRVAPAAAWRKREWHGDGGVSGRLVVLTRVAAYHGVARVGAFARTVLYDVSALLRGIISSRNERHASCVRGDLVLRGAARRA
jgi:hypothetical protein